jgi:cysteinyl-tRNA synthetase
MYTCGPTVYNFPHLGNLRTYIFEDVLKRTLIYNGYKVKHVMNITDVGHLTSDADEGEDKLEKEAKIEGKKPLEIADFYTKAFKQDLMSLNIFPPNIYCAASKHIKEQIELIKKLFEKGFAYDTPEAVYFEVSKFNDYTKLSGQKIAEKIVGAREEVEIGSHKKHSADFVLWFKLVGKYKNHILHWASPWGEGFPGWHIECSAMSMKYLGQQFDIHCGGVDHINVHHTNEIAQSEVATGKKPWVKYWLHGEFLIIKGGEKMAKSAGNFLTLKNSFTDKNLNPLAYRYAVLQTHYRKQMEYTDEIAQGAQNGLNNLYQDIKRIAFLASADNFFNRLKIKITKPNKIFQEEFLSKINNDLNTPEALALLQELLKSNLLPAEKLATLLDFDKVFGLDFTKYIFYLKTDQDLPLEYKNLIKQRERARAEKNWQKADEIRKQLEKEGIILEDAPGGTKWHTERK